MEILKFESFNTPDGWVNVKIDKQLFKRINRYVYSLDTLLPNKSDRYDLYKKIDMLSNIEKYISDQSISIHTKISIITLLQYLNELRSHFGASSSGFLIEGFLASLVHGKAEDGFGIADVIGGSDSDEEDEGILFNTEGNGTKRLSYQIKLYKKTGGDIKVNMTTLCDYYVICLKDSSEKIDIHILSANEYDPSFIGKYTSIKRDTGSYMRTRLNKKTGDEIRYCLITPNRLKNNTFSRTLDISNIDSLILTCGESVKDSIQVVYDQLSELHYDIDALVTGVDKNKKPISTETARVNADKTIQDINRGILSLETELVKVNKDI